MALSQSRRSTLSTPDILVVRIERLILANEIQAGSKLPPERELAQTLGVSRTSLRDALRALEVRGRIRRQPGLGTLITDPSATPHGNVLASGLDIAPAGLGDVMDVRACIEPPIAERAAIRASATDIAQLRNLIDEMTVNLTPREYAKLDRVFHRTVAQCADNPLLMRLLDRVNEIIEPSRDNSYLTKARQRLSIAEHREIVSAISRRDPEAAFRAATAHVESILAQAANQTGDEVPDRK
ncbi:FadR family transcriptional regulator [Cryobacterium algoritolerans]|uniref:FadR family transcriptional regulator n=1 Tax=Cryobacterium algoritolerans TaxID=1259184 RepID=A0A4R8WQU5_9MICO|nr:FadR/GntR family transcriptional regulator [Cryobacterium algoritolerans]TFC14322.1 FadR family transcriptional regulator [Cryobacterium algoritolerans]